MIEYKTTTSVLVNHSKIGKASSESSTRDT
jgi:hypothetical protein